MPRDWAKTIIGVGCASALLLAGHRATAAEQAPSSASARNQPATPPVTPVTPTPLTTAPTPAANAAGDSPRFRLVYVAPDGCPDRSAFLAAIRARTPRPQLADEGDVAIDFTVTIDVGAGASSGRLDVRDPDGAEQRRSMSSRTCSEVAKALALVTALILDPDAQTGSDLPPAPPPPPDLGSNVEPSPPPVRHRAPHRSSPPPVPPGRPWLLAAGGHVGILGGIAPTVAPSFGALIDLEYRPGAGHDGRPSSTVAAPPRPRTTSLFTPAVRLSVDFAATASDLPVGSQSYWWLGGTLRACPIHVPLPDRLRLAPCAAFQVAGHHGTTRGVPNPSSELGLWLAPVFGGSFEWAIHPAVSLELEGGALFPMRRTRFFLAPNTTIFKVPSVSGTAALAVRVRFW